MAFPDGVRDVVVLRDGVRRVIVPTESAWDDFFSAPGIDLAPREQPEVRDRETVDG
jgi:antitoxin VapB